MRRWNFVPWSSALGLRLQRAYRYSELRKLRVWLEGRNLHWALYLTLTALFVGGLLGLHNHLNSFFFVVRVDNLEVGLVREAEEVEHFLDELMEKCSLLYGMDVTPRQEITLTRELRPGQEADSKLVKEALQRVSLVTEAYMVMVDGNPVTPVYTKPEIDTVIELLSLAYISQDENVKLLESKVVEHVYGQKCVVPPEQVNSPEMVVSLLMRQEQHQEQLVASRDVQISRLGRLEVEDENNTEIPSIHVITVEALTQEERIPFTTTYTNNSNMFIGQSRVTTPGVDGRKEVTYKVTRENGAEIDREALSEQVIEEPVVQVVERGTGRRFTWPVAGGGRITQYFRGTAHRGIDIAAALGTPILAAESGVVVRSQNVWPMGNHIIINHGDYWTLYLHNSRNLVSAGQRVSRGQTIAYLGSTGRSTGPHLHFEIRRSNGSGVWSSWTAHPAIDPMQFFR